MRTRTVAAWLLGLASVAGGCDGGSAPSGWAERHGLAGGGPAPDRPVNDPRDDAPSAKIGRVGERLSLTVTVGLFSLGALGLVVVVAILEARRRRRQDGAHGSELTEKPRRRRAG
jgi:hypothetical protein